MAIIVGKDLIVKILKLCPDLQLRYKLGTHLQFFLHILTNFSLFNIYVCINNTSVVVYGFIVCHVNVR